MKMFLIFVFLASRGLSAATATASVGQTATFSVTAAGTAPFTYQWVKEATPITGATSATYTINPLKLTDAGNYKVTVLNSAGSTVSDVASLTVTSTAVTGTADFSKQFLTAHLAAPYDPPVAQFPNFAIVPLKKVSDPGSHFNDTTGIYTVGVGEAGIYSIKTTIRSQDQPPVNVSIGITEGTTNLDEFTLWTMTPSPTTNYVRWGAEHEDIRYYPDGAQLRVNMFVQSAINILGVDVTMRRLY